MHWMGLDLSLTGTGVVIIDDLGNVLKSGTYGEKLERKATEKEKIERMIWIATQVVRDSREFDTKVIGIEGFAFRAKGAQNDLGELHGVIKSQILMSLKIVPIIVPVKTARKTVLGNGNMKKDKVFACVSKLGFGNDNEADAYVIAECLRLQFLGEKND